MTTEQRARHNARVREYQFNRYRNDEAFRQAHIERVKRCTVKKVVSALTGEQAAKRRASDAARQARRRSAKKAAAVAAP